MGHRARGPGLPRSTSASAFAPETIGRSVNRRAGCAGRERLGSRPSRSAVSIPRLSTAAPRRHWRAARHRGRRAPPRPRRGRRPIPWRIARSGLSARAANAPRGRSSCGLLAVSQPVVGHGQEEEVEGVGLAAVGGQASLQGRDGLGVPGPTRYWTTPSVLREMRLARGQGHGPLAQRQRPVQVAPRLRPVGQLPGSVVAAVAPAVLGRRAGPVSAPARPPGRRSRARIVSGIRRSSPEWPESERRPVAGGSPGSSRRSPPGGGLRLARAWARWW